MVTLDEDLVAVELLHDLAEFGGLPPVEGVATPQDCIVLGNNGVVPFDQLTGHVFGIAEGAGAMLDDVVVSIVWIRIERGN